MPTLVAGFPQFDPTSFENDEEIGSPISDLQAMFNLQRLLMSACGIENMPADLAFWITNDALIAEAQEATHNFVDQTKPWKCNAVADIPALKEEVVDQFFFVMQAAILLGMTSEEFVALYKEKSTKNFQRIMEKMKVG